MKNKKLSRLSALKNQVRRLQKRLENLQHLSKRFSWYRLIIFLSAILIGIPIFWVNHSWSYFIIGIALIIFNIVAFFHRKVEAAVQKYSIYLGIKKSHIARLTLDWENIPEELDFKIDEQHPFEIDLDITGRHSLHHLLDISVSQSGSQRLRDWLLNTNPDKKIIQQRQQIIEELTPLTLFRDKFLLNFYLLSKERLNDKRLLNWLNQSQSSKPLKRVLMVSSALAGVNWLLLFAHIFLNIPSYFIYSFAVYVIFYLMNSKVRSSIFDEAEFLLDEIKKYKIIFQYLEKYPYNRKINLKNLITVFLEKRDKPSVQIKKLTLITTAIGLRMNYILGIILNGALPWDFYFAFRLNKCRLRFQQKFPVWLDTCFELEALTSLANFNYLNPEYEFPKIKKNNGERILFEAEKLGHPLLPFQQKITNDFILKDTGEMALITGSNMSGKSTFLRTVGINLALAFAGAPVNAFRFQVNLCRIYTCIRVNDSIFAGVSQFYAEVKRLKTLLNELEEKNQQPLFFLIDEIFKGTNNRERLIGSRSFIRSLIGLNGAGLISTHDLELTNLEIEFSNFKNFHFREEVKNGKMIFDYKLRSGPCPTTNALKIMQLEGLPVDNIDKY